MTPSIGRIVHYQSQILQTGESVAFAAIVTFVHSDDNVSLAVFTPNGALFTQSVPYDADCAAGTWHWPPRKPQP